MSAVAELGDKLAKLTIAEAVELPESAIPCATAGKYLHTPRGVFEFRFLVSSPIVRTEGVAA